MEKLCSRNEIQDEFKWKIDDIFAGDEIWEDAYNELNKIADMECEYKGHMSDSAQNLVSAIKAMDDEEYRVEKVYVYAFMKYYEDTTNPKYQEMSGKAQLISMKISEKYAFFVPEIMEIPDDLMKEYIDDEQLRGYRHFLLDILEEKEHTLSEREEKLLAMAEQLSSSPKEIFSQFNNADIKFDVIKDEEGNDVLLTHGRYTKFMESHNRDVRQATFKALYKPYISNINSIASTYYANVKQAIFYAKARKYSDTLTMYLDGSFIPKSVYTNLIKTVNSNLSSMHKYVDIRKKELGVDKLHFYDIYAPMVPDFKLKITYEEAKKIVLDALKPLGEDYVNQVRAGFNSGWVDVYENIGKRNGAFSWGEYGTHPYVFMNYSDTLNDVFTLIHEMGHAMHSFMSNSSQPHIYAGYRIFVAEVASTCNEALLINYLLEKCTDKKERKYIINYYLEQFKGTLFRQTMFAEFEMTAHAKAEGQEVLNADYLCKMYLELNEKYFGKNMEMDSEIAYEWARIPHFYTPFYVYQYATGFSAAIAIASKILSGDKSVLLGYKKFLSGGSSLHPIELLKLCGIDMNEPQVIQDALNVFSDLLDMWEE